MSEAIILGAIRTLESFLVETYIDTYHEQVLEEVTNELRMMLDFLKDKESGERNKLHNLLADFADVAQESVDLTRIINSRYFNDKISYARDWLRKARKRMTDFGVAERVSRPQSDGEDEGHVVVGLEKDVQQLIGKVILNEEVTQSVSLCIKGMVGAGKTTLARQVYNHPAVVEKFKRRAWVSLCRDTSEKEVLVELINQLVELDGDSLLLEEMDKRSLKGVLYSHMKGMSYFVVLDNMFPEMRLEPILGGLPMKAPSMDSGHGDRVLLVTRCKIRETKIYYTHEMKALDSFKSWQLFMKTIDKFTSEENKFSKELERKGKEMLKKCGGLPMAIIDVARQKAKQRLSGIEWEELFDSIDLSESLKKLEPMYHELDEDLKPCFLHMSFFKVNAIMREEKLIQIWDASGLNTRRHVAYNLVNQSVIEPLYLYAPIYEVKRCRINPLLHMLSIKKAEEEMGFEVLSSNGNSCISHSPRHRVIHFGRDKFNHCTNQDKQLLSLIFHGGGHYLDVSSQSYWKNFELLKILDMEDFGMKTLSDAIGTLIELRYLGLRNNYIQEIPHSFGDMKRLEVLDVALNFMVEVSNIICEMGSLHYLYMSDVIYRTPFKVDALQNLKTLTYISIYDWAYEGSNLETMTHLKKLGIEEVDENSDVGKLFASVAKFNSLENLILRGFRFRSMPCLDEISVLQELFTLRLEGLLSRLPSADNFPRRIYDLVLVNTCLDEDPMPVLGKMPRLGRLKLRNAYTGEKMLICDRGFPKLEILCIKELWNLRGIQVSKLAVPYLMHLEIKNCPHLETLPEEIGTMHKQRVFEMETTKLRVFEMVTTKHIATKIRSSGLTSGIMKADISP